MTIKTEKQIKLQQTKLLFCVVIYEYKKLSENKYKGG